MTVLHSLTVPGTESPGKIMKTFFCLYKNSTFFDLKVLENELLKSILLSPKVSKYIPKTPSILYRSLQKNVFKKFPKAFFDPHCFWTEGLKKLK